MTLRLRSETIGNFTAAMKEHQDTIARAATATMRDVADLGKKAGRAAVASGGFSRKWQGSIQSKVFPPKGNSLHPAALVYSKISYAGVFQTGATITGKPTLWLPLPGAPRKPGGRQLSPAQYIDIVGPLMKIKSRSGRPLLIGRTAKITNRTGGGRFGRLKKIAGNRVGPSVRLTGQSIPLYVGISSVNIPQKFDVLGPVRAVASQIPALYQKNLQAL